MTWATFLLACTPSAPEQAAVVTRDSNGIQIVENARPTWSGGQGWQLSPSPRIAIGELDGADHYLLNRVTGAIRLSDGRIIVANSATAELRAYDATGRFIKTVGCKGWGPGEFQRPDHVLRLVGDTIAAWDAGIGPISYFDDSLRYIRRERVERGRLLDLIGTARATEALTPLPDGSFVLHVTIRDACANVPEGVLHRAPLGFCRFTRDLSRFDSLGWYGGLPQLYLKIGGRRVNGLPLIPMHAAVTAGGRPLRIYAGNGDPYEINTFDEMGRLSRVIRRTDPPIPLPPDIEQRVKRSGDDGYDRQARERVRAALPRQTHYPAYWRLHSDADGNLWVLSFGDGMHVFDRDGRWLGPVTVPGQPLEIGRDYMLLLQRDSLSVERVALYDLRRSNP